VLDIEEDGDESVYLVHYTGWNTRYDEWIKRGRIADNLSWTPSRAKRLRHQQAQAQLKVTLHCHFCNKHGLYNVNCRYFKTLLGNIKSEYSSCVKTVCKILK